MKYSILFIQVVPKTVSPKIFYPFLAKEHHFSRTPCICFVAGYWQVVAQLVAPVNIVGQYSLTGTGLNILPLYGNGTLSITVGLPAEKRGQ